MVTQAETKATMNPADKGEGREDAPVIRERTSHEVRGCIGQLVFYVSLGVCLTP